MTNTERKLRKVGFGALIGDSVKILNTSNIVVVVRDRDSCDWNATEALMEEVIKALDTDKTKWGGFRAAGGWWYLEKNYDSAPLDAAYRDQMGGAR